MPVSFSDNAKLETRGVSVTFGGFNALTDVSMSLSAGSVVGLIGPNGAGKTTLVNVLTGFQSPSSGEVLLGTEAVGAHSPFALRRLGIARTFQAGRLFTGLDVLDNLAVTGTGLGHSRRAAEEEARSVLDWMDIRHLSDLPASGLPYTDERRVGIARALMYRPDFLLLDEPAAGMSEIEAEELSQLIARIASELGIGVLLIEHNVGLVLGVCEQVYVLDAGQIIEQGDRATILASQAVRDAYLGASHEEAA
ncbi:MULTISPECIES: ABC transporter ATP-binding protein [Roseobacteraceae]|uniref:ABC transporter ATP-binding protein n=1 Tax=Roseobacteraceae TaxID=2854170 RepID=UPI0007C39BC7|nr:MULTISPECIES: ABC transporter ATP-binding protein [unclassified Sulfitobacter]MEC9312901.1 ABC transporter ATP-binding protein [Pseudomonadota bacterium]KZY05038.1 ABC transporter ATP-binding protein [Sulfitobacter sp. HI0023]KZY27220.1 ABC transporter ATP-binding protein [Sulfitobacter sp. HI0040]KZY49157.1 ABC transporter ATP-binding protein [Sulfitobacter sp. HI0054]KZZ68421.1 ABC transporter ATP-binding protein [Sulfitobacter sp. HI0129]